MKRLLYIIGIISCCIGCKTYTKSCAIPTAAHVPDIMENMTIVSTSSKVKGFMYNPKHAAIIDDYIIQDLNANFVRRSSQKSTGGRIEIKTSMSSHKFHWFWPVMPLSPLCLLGVPCGPHEVDATTTFTIKDRNNNVVKIFKIHSKRKKMTGLYYGESMKRMSLEAAKEIMTEFRNTYESEGTGKEICETLKKTPTKEQLAAMPPATIYLINHPDLSAWSEQMKNTRKREILYVDVNGKYIGDFKLNSTLILQVPPGDVNIKLYRNHSKEYYSSPGTPCDGYNEAKRNGAVTECPILYTKSGEKYYLNISNASYLQVYKTNFENVSKAETADLNVVTYDMRNPKQKLVTITNSASSASTTSDFAVETRSTQPTTLKKEQSVSMPRTISHVDKDIPLVGERSSDTYVLIFANEDYTYLDDVSYAGNDGAIFKEYCTKTLGVFDKQVFYYQNATLGNITDGVEKLTYCLNNFEGAKAIVYYCGHGIPDEKTGQAYLIPVDGKGTNMTTCYSLKNLYKTLAATKAQSITYFMDACFTGANKEGSMLVAARGVAREPVKETLAGKTVVFSASSGDETAMTLEEQGHGLFTYYLLKKLQETEGNVTYGELADYINKNVKKDAFLINEKPQTPVVATSPAVQNTWKTMKLK